MKPHKRLECWRLSFNLVKDIYILTQAFPEGEKYGLTSQIRRSAVSVPANIAEGAARKSKKDFVRFLSIAEGSLSELDTLLLLAVSIEYCNSEQVDPLLNALDNISRMIVGLIRKLELPIS